MTGPSERETALRLAAMKYLDGRLIPHVDYGWTKNFVFEGERIPLMDRGRGIRKPISLEAALAITTVYTPPNRNPPYADVIGPDGLQRYKYQGDDANPDRSDNRALRRAHELDVPLIWFVGINDRAQYLPIYPVWVVAEETKQGQFVLALDPAQRLITPMASTDDDTRRYVERMTKARLHQRVFRAQVMDAYSARCAVCSLAHRELLDAAHIIADGLPRGDPVVPNGLAMCKIHHAAYDSRILGIRPDFTLHIREDILVEIDGPMLRHGLQEMHNRALMVLPSRRAMRPDVTRLEERYALFQSA